MWEYKTCIQCMFAMCIWYKMSPIPNGIMYHNRYVVILSTVHATMTIPLSRVTHSTYVYGIDRIKWKCVYICMMCCRFFSYQWQCTRGIDWPYAWYDTKQRFGDNVDVPLFYWATLPSTTYINMYLMLWKLGWECFNGSIT